MVGSTILLALLFAFSPADPSDDGAWALVGARLLPAAGAEVIEDGVLLVRQGRIEALGADVELPADVRAIDVRGLTLAPALVDAAHHGALVFPDHEVMQGRPVDDSRDTLAAMVDGNRRGLAPERHAWEGLAAGGSDLVEHRKAGFGALMLAPGDMLLAGFGAWLAPNGLPAREALLSGDVAQFGSLGWRGSRDDYSGSAYPATLMGVMAHLRQMLLDAQHRALVAERFDRNRSARRPVQDAGLMALGDVLDGRQPLVLNVAEEEDIRLALGLVDDFPGLRLIIAGGREAWELADLLAERGVGVILDLGFPDEPDDPADAKDVEPASPRPGAGWPRPLAFDDHFPRRLVQDRHDRWLERVSGAARLLEAGVPLAFASFGGEPGELVKGVRTAIEHGGLSADDALTVLTRGARRVFGSSAPSGELVPGDTAFVAGWDGDPLAEKSHVKLLIVEGRLFDLRSAAERRGEKADDETDESLAGAGGPKPGDPDQAADDAESVDALIDPQSPQPVTTTDVAVGSDVPEQPEAGVGDEQVVVVDVVDVLPADALPEQAAADAEPKPYAGPLARTAFQVALAAAERAATEVDWPVELDADRVPSIHTGGDVLLRGGHLLTVSDGLLESTDLLVREGRIAAIGKRLPLPEGVTEIDVAGRWIMPGVLDAHAHIAIRGGINEWTRNITPEVTIEDEVDPDDVGIYRALAGGTTSARLLHGSANAIGGRHEVVKLRWGSSAPEMVFDGAPRGVKFALGENPRQANWGDGGRFPKTRMGVATSLRRAFEAGRRYVAEWARFAAAEAAGEDPDPPRRDLRLEALAGILAGEIAVHSHCYRADEILMLLSVAEEFGFKVQTFQHALEAYKVAREIGAHGGAGASTFIDWWGFKFEAYDAIPYNPALVHEAGVAMSINSDSDDHIRRLNLEAAKAVKYGGVSESDALAMVTLVPAQQLGVAERVGSISVGKDADLAVYDRHPFDTRSHVVLALVDGEVRFERTEGAYAAWEAEVAQRVAAGRVALVEPPALPARDPVEARNRDVDLAALQALALPRAGTGAASTPARPQPAAVALVGGTVHTMLRQDDGSLLVHEPGVVLVRDGRVVDVLPGSAPRTWLVADGYEVRDVTGSQVWPGLVDGGNALGLGEISMVRQSMDVNESGGDQADIRASTAWHPASETIPVARVNGVTTSLVVPGGRGIRGTSSVMALEGWTAAEALVRDGAALHVSVPRVDRHADDADWQAEQVREAEAQEHCDMQGGAVPLDVVEATAGRRGKDKGKGDAKQAGDPWSDKLDEAWESLASTFADAREYARQAGAALSSGGDGPRHDPRLEAIAPFALGAGRVHFHCDRADQIADALDFADREGLDAVIAGGQQAWKVADRLALAGVPVLVGPVFALPPGRNERYDSSYANAGILQRAGVTIGFRSDSNHDVRNLPYQAAMAVAFGLDEQDAMYALTAGAAAVLGLGDEIGTIAAGRRADLLVTAGSPLQIVDAVRAVYIGGRDVGLESKHTRLYEQYRARLLDPGRPSGR